LWQRSCRLIPRQRSQKRQEAYMPVFTYKISWPDSALKPFNGSMISY
jgi:hypothetical protein